MFWLVINHEQEAYRALYGQIHDILKRIIKEQIQRAEDPQKDHLKYVSLILYMMNLANNERQKQRKQINAAKEKVLIGLCLKGAHRNQAKFYRSIWQLRSNWQLVRVPKFC